MPRLVSIVLSLSFVVLLGSAGAADAVGHPGEAKARLAAEHSLSCAYLLGEPVFVRPRLRPQTEDMVLWWRPDLDVNSFFLRILDDSGKPVGRRIYDRFGGSPVRMLIRAGESYAVPLPSNLCGSYDIRREGVYSVALHFLLREAGAGSHEEYGDGDYDVSRDRELVADLPDLWIVLPVTEVDSAALRMMLQAMKDRLGERYARSKFVLGRSFHLREIRKSLLADFPHSRYTAYARYYESLSCMYDFRRTGVRQDVLTGIEHLQKIELDGLPDLFQEMVCYQLICALRESGEQGEKLAALVSQFRKRFPQSPLIVDGDQKPATRLPRLMPVPQQE